MRESKRNHAPLDPFSQSSAALFRNMARRTSGLGVQWGAAYRLSGTPAEQQETLKYLEWREKQYDLRYRSDVFGRDTNGQPLVTGALCCSGNRTSVVSFASLQLS